MNTDSKENLRVKIEELRHSLNEKVENNLQTKLSNESSLSENSVEEIGLVESKVRLEELKVWLKKMLTVQIFLCKYQQ